MLYILYLWSATLAAPLVFPRLFTLRAFFCCWYMPAKLNFLTQIKCTRQSSKLRKRVQLYRCWSAALTNSCSPQPHTCTAPSARSHSMPHTHSSLPSEINQVCDGEEQTLSIRSSPDVSLNSPEQSLEQLPRPTPEQGQQQLLIFITGKFCASNQQEQRFHLKASRVQDHKACRHFYPWILMLILVSLCAINDQSKEDPPQSSECMCFVGGFVLLLSLCRSEKGKIHKWRSNISANQM